MIILKITDLALELKYEVLKVYCMKHFKKPDNVTWDEVTLIQLLVVADNYLIKGIDLVHTDEVPK